MLQPFSHLQQEHIAFVVREVSRAWARQLDLIGVCPSIVAAAYGAVFLDRLEEQEKYRLVGGRLWITSSKHDDPAEHKIDLKDRKDLFNCPYYWIEQNDCSSGKDSEIIDFCTWTYPYLVQEQGLTWRQGKTKEFFWGPSSADSLSWILLEESWVLLNRQQGATLEAESFLTEKMEILERLVDLGCQMFQDYSLEVVCVPESKQILLLRPSNFQSDEVASPPPSLSPWGPKPRI